MVELYNFANFEDVISARISARTIAVLITISWNTVRQGRFRVPLTLAALALTSWLLSGLFHSHSDIFEVLWVCNNNFSRHGSALIDVISSQ